MTRCMGMRRVVMGVLVALALPGPAVAAVVVDGRPPAVPAVKPPPPGTDVRGALERAVFTGAVDPAQARRWRADVTLARHVIHRLDGARAAELRAVLVELDGLAATQRLTAARMPLAFLTIERNITEWRTKSFPSPGERMTFGRDPAVFQYFPGRGVQFHALATAGVANALAKPCQAATERIAARGVARADRRAFNYRVGVVRAPVAHDVDWGSCHPGKLRRTLDRLVELASHRGGFTAWEYQFAFGGGYPPWISAMTQATAAQALARGADALGDDRYRTTALDTLGAFTTPPPVGVANGHEYLMYSFSPGLHVLNGELQALIGLHDVAELTGSKLAARLFAAGEARVRPTVRSFDTGAWSRYSLDGRESTFSYHDLLTGFLGGLCDRTGRQLYCDEHTRFTRYEHEPPRIHLALRSRALHNHQTGFTFSLSKVSTLRWSVTGAHGLVASNDLSLPRGRYPVTWTPPSKGTFTIRVSGVGPEGLRGTTSATVTAKEDPAIIAARKLAKKLRKIAALKRRQQAEKRRAERARRHATRAHRHARG